MLQDDIVLKIIKEPEETAPWAADAQRDLRCGLQQRSVRETGGGVQGLRRKHAGEVERPGIGHQAHAHTAQQAQVIYVMIFVVSIVVGKCIIAFYITIAN